MRRLQLQLASEILRPMAATLALLLVLLFAMQLLRGADLLLGAGVGAQVPGRMVSLLAPHFLALALPIAFLAGTLVGLGRLAEDRELLAMAAAGVDPLWLLPVPLAIAGLLSWGGLALAAGPAPRGLAGARALASAALEENLRAGIRPGVFFDGLAGLTLYAGRVDPRTHAWSDVLVHDERDRDGPMLVLAKRGRLEVEPGGAMSLALTDGEVHRGVENGERYALMHFQQARFEVGAGRRLIRSGFSPSTTDLIDTPALREAAKREPNPARANELWTALARRSALPLAPLVFALIAVPLGARLRRGARALGLTLAACSFGIYYVLARLGEQWGNAGALPATLAAQLANLGFLVVGAALIFGMRRRA